MVHYLIITVIILLIVIFQWKYFIDTRKRIQVLKTIFPQQTGYEYRMVDDVSDNDESSSNKELSNGITTKHNNIVFNEIIRSINAYLQNNKGRVSDYHLMKDIVDRNCDTAEEEIDSQVPVPLYLGLMGTMAGILVGVGYLWISGDLNMLLDAGGNAVATSHGSGADGVKTLLGGVALAMISSIMGIILTTRGSMLLKEAKSELQKRKHSFLSWMQANMLPHLNNDTAQVLERMTRNLTKFNQEFYGNTRELKASLAQVSDTTAVQMQLIEAVNQLANKHVAKQNLDLYNALRNSTEEIGKLAELLHDSTAYLDAVRRLNQRLDKGERRNEAIERMADFFESETKQIEQRKATMTHAIGLIDSTLEENMRHLGEHANKNLESFSVALGKQQDILQKKLSETESLIQELKSLSPIKDSISKFEKATKEQNAKIDALTNAIRQFAESKANANGISAPIAQKKGSCWKKIIITGIISIVTIMIVAVVIANWEELYLLLLSNFKF